MLPTDYILRTRGRLVDGIANNRRKLMGKRMKHDFHAFLLNVGMPPAEDLSQHFDLIEPMPPEVRQHMQYRQRGLGFPHWLLADMYRWQRRDSNEKVRDLPLYTSLGDIIKKYFGGPDQPPCVRVWYPTRKDFFKPIVEMGDWSQESLIPDVGSGKYSEGMWIKLVPNTRNMAVILPRGMLKSTVARCADAFSIARNPLLRILLLSGNQQLANKHLVTLKNIFESDAWQYYFPGITPSETEWSTRKITVNGPRKRHTKDPTMEAVGLDTRITGGHVELNDIDDLEFEGCDSGETPEQIRRKFVEYVEQIGDAGSYFTLSGTIWLPDNVMMGLRSGEMAMPCNLVIGDCLDVEDQTIYLKYPTEYIHGKRDRLPPDEFAHQWRVAPYLQTNTVFALDCIEFMPRTEWAREAKKIKYDEVVVCTDLAFSSKKTSDYTATCAMGRKYNSTTKQDDIWILFFAVTKANQANRVIHHIRAVRHVQKFYGMEKVKDYVELGPYDRRDFIVESLKKKWSWDGEGHRPLRLKLIPFQRRTKGGVLESKRNQIMHASEIVRQHRVVMPSEFYWRYDQGGRKRGTGGTKAQSIDHIRIFHRQAMAFDGKKSRLHRKDDALDAFSMCIAMMGIQTNWGLLQEKPDEEEMPMSRRSDADATWWQEEVMSSQASGPVFFQEDVFTGENENSHAYDDVSDIMVGVGDLLLDPITQSQRTPKHKIEFIDGRSEIVAKKYRKKIEAVFSPPDDPLSDRASGQ